MMEGEKGLSPKERRVLELLEQGLTTKEIARAMALTPNTVRQYLVNIRLKLHDDL
jgi:DNA-binding CsgD family transcriptional regulator